MTLLRILLALIAASFLVACGGRTELGRAKAPSPPGLVGITPAKSGVAKAEALEESAATVPTPGMPLPLEPAPVAAYGQPAAPALPGAQPPAPPQRPPVANDGVESGQMLVYTANLTLAVYQVEQGFVGVERVAKELGGYLASRTDVAITIRVPRAQFETALKRIEPAGDVLHREIKAEDVTDEFFDLEARLRNARAMRDRLTKLLQQAAVKDALDIEKELARVTEEIERIEGKLKLFRHRVAYSTIEVTFQARGAAVSTRPLRLPFSWLDQLGLPNLLQLEDR